MSFRCLCEVNFLGGPVDGLADIMALPLERFLGVIQHHPHKGTDQPLLTAVNQMLRHDKRLAKITLAVYEADERTGSKLWYRHIGTVAVTEDQLENDNEICQIMQRLEEKQRLEKKAPRFQPVQGPHDWM